MEDLWYGKMETEIKHFSEIQTFVKHLINEGIICKLEYNGIEVVTEMKSVIIAPNKNFIN